MEGNKLCCCKQPPNPMLSTPLPGTAPPGATGRGRLRQESACEIPPATTARSDASPSGCYEAQGELSPPKKKNQCRLGPPTCCTPKLAHPKACKSFAKVATAVLGQHRGQCSTVPTEQTHHTVTQGDNTARGANSLHRDTGGSVSQSPRCKPHCSQERVQPSSPCAQHCHTTCPLYLRPR